MTNSAEKNPVDHRDPDRKPIGSFFDLELPRQTKGELHRDAAHFNTARSGLRAILKARGIRVLWLPKYICPSVPDAVEAEGVTVKWFPVDRSLHFNTEGIPEEDWALCVNYFGVRTRIVRLFCQNHPKTIVDNTQAFFETSVGLDRIYSPRKWVGVPDGGYAYSPIDLSEEEYPIDSSESRLPFLISRLSTGTPEEGYPLYRQTEEALDRESILRMSHLTRRLLERIDYETIRQKRRENFLTLHSHLRERNELSVSLEEDEVPLFYPFLTGDETLRPFLIGEKVFVATLWNGVERWSGESGDETYLTRHLLPLPIDQRYGEAEMESIVCLLKSRR